MPDNWEEYSSLNQTTKNSNLRWKTLVESWKFRCRGETRRNFGKRKTKYVCIVDADGSMKPRLENVPQRCHEDHITAERENSLSHYNLVHKFIPMRQALKVPGAKAAVERMGKLEKHQLEHGWGKIPNWECLFVHREKGLTVLISVRGRYQTVGKTQKH